MTKVAAISLDARWIRVKSQYNLAIQDTRLDTAKYPAIIHTPAVKILTPPTHAAATGDYIVRRNICIVQPLHSYNLRMLHILRLNNLSPYLLIIEDPSFC